MASLDSTAEEAVRRLDIEAKVQADRRVLQARIEEVALMANAAPVDGEMQFVAGCLPIIHGFIQFAASRRSLGAAIDWVRNEWPFPGVDIDPLATLAVLTLLYVVRDARDHAGSPADTRAWARRYELLLRLSA
ncbi:MAG TPA: hypothetical protein VJ276_07970 [Thermoanaerobaculia bacterium]|nr:hypothetical protein [Thermoanaerobaculia bacterium]